MPNTECPICARAASPRLAESRPARAIPCDHVALRPDVTGYTGAGFALQYCFVYIERGTPRGRTFLDIDQEIVSILQRYMEIVNSTGYAESPQDALRAATAAVKSHLLDLGYAVPDNGQETSR